MRINSVNADTIRTPQIGPVQRLQRRRRRSAERLPGATSGRASTTTRSRRSRRAAPTHAQLARRDGQASARVRFFASGSVHGRPGRDQASSTASSSAAAASTSTTTSAATCYVSISTMYDKARRERARRGLSARCCAARPPGTNYLARDTLGRPILLRRRRGHSARPATAPAAFLYNPGERRSTIASSDRFLGSLTATLLPGRLGHVRRHVRLRQPQRASTTRLRPKGYRTHDDQRQHEHRQR